METHDLIDHLSRLWSISPSGNYDVEKAEELLEEWYGELNAETIASELEQIDLEERVSDLSGKLKEAEDSVVVLVNTLNDVKGERDALRAKVEELQLLVDSSRQVSSDAEPKVESKKRVKSVEAKPAEVTTDEQDSGLPSAPKEE